MACRNLALSKRAKEYKTQKKLLPCFTPSGTFSGRTKSTLLEHSGFIVVDLDHVGGRLEAIRQQAQSDPFIAFGFLSPSADGLKLGFRIPGGQHAGGFRSAETHVREKYAFQIDKACKDVSRLCIVSYDPDLWTSMNASILPVQAAIIADVCTEETEETEVTEDTEDVKGWVFFVRNMEDALRAATPTGTHTSNNGIFTFSRALLALEKQRGSKHDRSELLDAFNKWYQMAYQTGFLTPGQTKEDYMVEFMDIYRKTKHPLGSKTLARAWKLAEEQPLPRAAALFENHQRKRLVALCFQLQRIHGAEPFYLSGRTCMSLFEHENHSTSAKWLGSLCSLKVLKEIKKGNGNSATRYQYVDPEQ
jgi:hypothetical protein